MSVVGKSCWPSCSTLGAAAYGSRRKAGTTTEYTPAFSRRDAPRLRRGNPGARHDEVTETKMAGSFDPAIAAQSDRLALRRKLVGDAGADGVDGLAAGLVGGGGYARDRRYRAAGEFDAAEIVVQVFSARDPVRTADEGFDANACNPAEQVPRDFADGGLNADAREDRDAGGVAQLMLPSQTAGAIQQPVRCHRVAEAAAHGAEIFDVVGHRFGQSGCRNRCRDSLDAGRGAVDLEAGNEVGVLPVVAGVSAAEPALGLDAADGGIEEEHGREIVFLPGVAAMGAEIEAGPALQGRRHARRLGVGRGGRRERGGVRTELVGDAGAHEVDGLVSRRDAAVEGVSGLIGEDVAVAVDAPEVVMQVFEARDPVRAAEHDFAPDAGDPAEPVARRHASRADGAGRPDLRVGEGALETLPRKA